MWYIIIDRYCVSQKGVHIFQQFNFLDNTWRNFSHNSFFIGNKRKSFGFVSEMLMAPLSYFASNAIINIYIPLTDTNDSFVDTFSKAEALRSYNKIHLLFLKKFQDEIFHFHFRAGIFKSLPTNFRIILVPST